MVAILGVIWGATFLLTEIALTGLPPLWIAAGRIGFAMVLTVAVWRLRGGALFLSERTAWPSLVLVGALASAVPFTLLAWGQQYVTAGFAGVSMAGVALMVLPLAHFLVPGERMHLRRAAGFLIGFLGVVLLIGGQAFASSGAALEPLGRAACVAAAGCYAVSMVTMRRLPPVDPIGLAAVPLMVGSVVVIPAALVVEGVPPLPSAEILAVVALLGLVPTAGANLLRVLVIRSAGPVFMSLVNYQVPVWSVVLGVVLLGEPFEVSLLAAMGLILAGLLVSQWGALKRLFGRRAETRPAECPTVGQVSAHEESMTYRDGFTKR
ncbi:DMT family transporter [Citreimonas salinaria]|uniref:Permease of the drug/metabolite transporter (DMT) superfamily n=1 Tax=Citreimonas salinaria TaxID=321339 RepID=A0A1H3K0U2_9RHOB|nr:DMT family transporter [Citreimonas salinaria]SDY45830.1 Permease of the drug/metabolite transporter (DMT) superfamily [Citreimonas salinaria]